MRKIQLKRGLKANMPTLSQAELGFTTDEETLYVGTGSKNIPLAPKAHTHTATELSAHKATHKTGGSDALTVGDLGGYSKDETLDAATKTLLGLNADAVPKDALALLASKVSYKLLKTVTTTQNAQHVQIDVSDIDFQKYEYVLMTVEADGDSRRDTEYPFEGELRFNNSLGGFLWRLTTDTYMPNPGSGVVHHNLADKNHVKQKTFVKIFVNNFICCETHSENDYLSYVSVSESPQHTINTVDYYNYYFRNGSSYGNILTGSKFVFYGVGRSD